MRFIYKKIEESQDKKLLEYCKNRWKLTDIEIRSVICNAKQIKNSFLSKIEQTKDEINVLKEEVTELEGKLNKLLNAKSKKKIATAKKTKKDLFNLNKKIQRKEKFLNSDIVFGSKKLLREISFLSNNKELNKESLNSKKIEYTAKRNGAIFLIGEANTKGNRYFDFDLINKVVYYKPYRGVKIEIKLCNRKDKFERELQTAIENKQIAISVSFNNDTFSITYDEATLCGFSINKTERKNEVNDKTKNCIDKTEKELIVKQVYKNYYDSLRERQMVGKIKNRYLAIDLNPEHIGYSIIDHNSESDEFKIIKLGSFNFKGLTKKSGLSSDNEYSKYKNNKRKHERKEVICELFNLMKHYKVGSFVMEDLNFKNDNSSFSKEFRRKTKNIWDRGLLCSLIKKKCTEGGYQLIEVNPVYSSLIGNLSYKVFDPVAASIEINRRGATKYESGNFYPKKNVSTIHTTEMVAKRNHIDVELIRDASYRDCYTILNGKRNKYRYRWGEKVGATLSFSLKSCKSRVKHTEYCVIYN
jgi:IS605 OrfB family transposase